MPLFLHGGRLLERRHVKTFEIDFSSNGWMSKHKKELLPPAACKHINFVEADQNALKDLQAKMVAAGYDCKAPTLFVMQGPGSPFASVLLCILTIFLGGRRGQLHCYKSAFQICALRKFLFHCLVLAGVSPWLTESNINDIFGFMTVATGCC